MKTCKWIRDAMIDRIEGELSSTDSEVFDIHLETCSACQQEFARYEKIYTRLQADDMPVPGASFWDALLLRIRQQHVPFYAKSSWIGRLLPVAVPVLAVGVVLFIFLTRPPSTIQMIVPVSELLEDEDIAAITLNAMVHDDLVEDFTIIEESLPFDIDEALNEMTSGERELFLKLMTESNGVGI